MASPLGTDKWTTREEIINASLHLAASRHYNEIHPEDPHGLDQVDLYSDMLDDALQDYINISAEIPEPIPLPRSKIQPLHSLPHVTSDD